MYPHEKFLVAVDAMATMQGSLRERVEAAWMSFHPLREENFEGELKSKFTELTGALTKLGPIIAPDGEVRVGSVHNTLENLSDDDVRKIADMIFSMFVNIAREYYGSLGADA
jgi:hypothetical protein